VQDGPYYSRHARGRRFTNSVYKRLRRDAMRCGQASDEGYASVYSATEVVVRTARYKSLCRPRPSVPSYSPVAPRERDVAELVGLETSIGFARQYVRSTQETRGLSRVLDRGNSMA
jgi:hypothetical protein